MATARNAAVDAWEFLTATPNDSDGNRCYPLRDELSTVTVQGKTHQQWQYKPTSGGRIWYAVSPPARQSSSRGVVWLVRVSTGHPNETVKQHR